MNDPNRRAASAPLEKLLATAEAARAFAESIVDTMREPLLVLDAELRVVAANRTFHEAFRVSPEETVGRLVYEIGNGQWDIPRLRALLEEIPPENGAFRDYEVEHVFEHIGRKIIRSARCWSRRGGDGNRPEDPNGEVPVRCTNPRMQPSRCFTVHSQRNVYCCHQCGSEGNALDLWIAAQTLDSQPRRSSLSGTRKGGPRRSMRAATIPFRDAFRKIPASSRHDALDNRRYI